MERNRLPQKWDPPFLQTGADPIHQMFQQMAADIERYFETFFKHPKWQQLAEQMAANRVQVEETDDAYQVSVFLNGIERPADIEAHYRNGHLFLRRTFQLQKKTDTDNGAVWQSYTEHFARTIPLAKPIDWNRRDIRADKGHWSIRLPKRN
ncbi:Hsp20/alpha crystallin family protein [Effusibacillus pohliae]|uniref:Hsp20/alpha crystallin family protein n=1 Tax=Effusibacillus pohliae TaxID=232270 RepID=UPI0003601AB2|nr:Hsp20/alpha crystallin family protein [Effusibacillus pohliae]